MIIFRERYDGDARKFEEALKKAKSGLHAAYEIFEDMKEEFSERRGGYSEREGEHYDGRYSSRSDYDERDSYRHREPEWEERRDSRGRYM